MEEQDYLLQTRINEMTNLIEQIGDVDAKYDAGILTDEQRIEQKARKRTFIKVLAAAQDGEYIDDKAMGAILDDMREQAAAPSLEEINAANIDYLMMVGGEW
ncbi:MULTISPECIES: hypothetical protein [Coriobacteriia]|uniref:hypothetical protein n=1 Tax=Coriobacteriia TaxID=84998 RepID=UPI0023F1FF8D|nr:hypothetical protein [Parvibacter caecicola]